MYLKSLTAKNFRNLSQVSVDLSKDLNLIYGDNAAGKSSFLEAITYLISGRSFRSSKQATFVENSADHFELFGIFSNNDRLGVSYSRKLSTRSIRLNSKSVRSLAEVVNLYPVQSISPESYHLIDSGPNERRKFLDWLLFHVEHSYHSYWNDFSRILKQRNACLREGQRSRIYLDTWNTKFVEAAKIVDVHREKMANLLASLLKDVLKEVKFEFHDSISLKYYSGYTGELADKLTGSVERDYQSGNTMYGPH
ncbi:MAG: DNA replication and repair protein RecF, partial [Kangiellaceae bacterium]|nr:DNA replication and repair protein RecF [Kangiellaceae bacterium]